MPSGFLRGGVIAIALSLLLGGCFETLGHPAYNHEPTSSQAALCQLGTQSNGNVIGYGCPAKP